MFRINIIRALLVLLAACAVWSLATRVGAWTAVAMWAGIMLILCVSAAMLLHTSGVGKVGWKNRVGGMLLPWGYSIGRGRLVPIVITSWIVWVLIAVSVVLAVDRDYAAAAGDASATNVARTANAGVWPVLLVVAWIVDGAALLYVLGVLTKNFSIASQSGRSLLKIMLILLALIGVSLALHLTGRTRSAALVAGGPPLILAIGYGAFVSMFLIFGRNARWN